MENQKGRYTSFDGFHQGFVYYADLRKNVRGSEQDGIRPMVVLQNDKGNKYGNTLIVAPITKEYKDRHSKCKKKRLCTQVSLHAEDYDFLHDDSKVITEQIRTIDKKRVVSSEKIGYVNEKDYKKIQSSTIISLGLVESFTTDSCEFKRGDIYLANLGEGIGREFKGFVPVVIIQNNKGNEYSPTVIIVPINLKSEAKLPTHVMLDEGNDPYVNINQKCTILAEQITTIDKERLISKIGHLSDEKMKEVNAAIIRSLAIDKKLIYRMWMKNKISHTACTA